MDTSWAMENHVKGCAARISRVTRKPWRTAPAVLSVYSLFYLFFSGRKSRFNVFGVDSGCLFVFSGDFYSVSFGSLGYFTQMKVGEDYPAEGFGAVIKRCPRGFSLCVISRLIFACWNNIRQSEILSFLSCTDDFSSRLGSFWCSSYTARQFASHLS